MMTFPIVRALLALLAGTCLCLSSADAAAPQVKTQAPGYYRLMLGEFEITALSDGTFDLDTPTMLNHTTQAHRSDLLALAFEGDAVPTSVNAYLVNTGDRLVLVDTGAAALFGPTLGHLMDNLLASGYRPEQVDDILITHLHPDHVGGLMQGTKRAFPNATVHAEQRDADYWLSRAVRDAAPEGSKAYFDGAVASMGPYISAGKFAPFSGATDLFPGIRAIPAPGHTPGHTLYAIESKGQKLVLWGDLMEVAAIQFVDPSVTVVFDTDASMTAAQRPKVYADAASGRYLVGVAHLPFPGIGHLRTETLGYTWVPIPYDSVR